MRFNGTFTYKPVGVNTKDPNTGFVVGNGANATVVKGCECQIDKSIPAKVVKGIDGQEYAYNYDVFIPKYCRDAVGLTIGCVVSLTFYNGVKDEFTVRGVDNTNRKYIEIWG